MYQEGERVATRSEEATGTEKYEEGEDMDEDGHIE